MNYQFECNCPHCLGVFEVNFPSMGAADLKRMSDAMRAFLKKEKCPICGRKLKSKKVNP